MVVDPLFFTILALVCNVSHLHLGGGPLTIMITEVLSCCLYQAVVCKHQFILASVLASPGLGGTGIRLMWLMCSTFHYLE